MQAKKLSTRIHNSRKTANVVHSDGLSPSIAVIQPQEVDDWWRAGRLTKEDEIHLVANSKDAAALRARGFENVFDVTVPGQWHPTYFARVEVVYIWASHDIEGRQYGLRIAKIIEKEENCRATINVTDPFGDSDRPIEKNAGLGLGDLNIDLESPYEYAAPFWCSDWLPAITGKQRALAENAEYSLDPLAMQPPAQETLYVLDGLLARSTINLLSGMAGFSGKSTMAAGLLARQANGQSFCGRQTQKGVGIFVSFESDYNVTRSILDANGGQKVTLIHGPGPRSADEGILALFELAATSGAALIVVDTLQDLLPGVDLIDGRKYGQANGAANRLAWIARYTGATLLFLHHATGDDKLMGNQGVYAAADTILHLSKKHELFSETQRVGRPLPKTLIRYDRERFQLLNDIEDREPDLDERILAALQKGSLTTEEIKAVVSNVDRKTVTGQLKDLVAAGRLTVAEGESKTRGRKPTVYSLSD